MVRAKLLLGARLVGVVLVAASSWAETHSSPPQVSAADNDTDQLPAQRESGELQRRFQEAVRDINRGNRTAAAAALQGLAAEMPTDWKAREEVGQEIRRAYWSDDEFASCAPVEERSERKKIVWVRPSWAQVHFMLGYIAIEENQPELATDHLGTALSLDPTHPHIFYERGHALLMLQQVEQALNHFRLAISIRPCAATAIRAPAYANQGVALIELDRLDEAETALEAALDIAPDYAKAQAELLYISTLRLGGKRRPLLPQ